MSASRPPVSERILRSESMRRALGISMFVPAGPSRAYLALLKGDPYHMPNARIAALSGLSESNLSQIHSGHRHPGRGRAPVVEVHRDTEAAILGVRPEVRVAQRGGGQVSPVGTRRRLQALAAAGFPLRHLSEQMEWGSDPQPVHRLITGKSATRYVQHSTLLKARQVYDEWSGLDPADAGFSKLAVSRARASAARRGYAPPRCWDPDTIDDPDAIPEWTGRCGTVHGWLIHEKEGIPVCGPCSDAHAGGFAVLSPAGLRDARVRANLSVADLARLTGVNRDTLGSWESGRTSPRDLSKLDLVLLALDVTLEEVIEWQQ